MNGVTERLVGRGDAVARLRAAIDGAGAGRRALVVVSGPAGIGKTALVRAATAGELRGWGTCVYDAGAAGYWPWTRALDALARQVPEAVAGADPLLATIAPAFGTFPAGTGERDQLLLMDAVGGWLERRDAAVGELTIPAAVASQSVTWSVPPTVPMDVAERTIRAAGKGRLQLRTLEELRYLAQMWLPVYCVRLTVAQPETRLLKTRLRATTVDNLYEALGGSYLGRLNQPGWTQVSVDHRTMLRPSTKDTKVHATLRKAVESYGRVSTQAARERHAATLALLGVPTPCESLSVDHTSLSHLPYYVGVLASGGRERVAAVSAWTGELSPTASEVLTAHISQLRSHVAAT